MSGPPGLRLHAAFDVGLAALYLWLGLFVVPSRSPLFHVAVVVLAALLSASGVTLALRLRVGWPLAFVTHVLLLTVAAAAILGLVASAAYLRGIYGPIGQGLALVAVIVAALLVELGALLPLLQLRFLRREDVRRCFHR